MTAWRTITHVCHYQLTGWVLLVASPWAVMIFSYLVNLFVSTQTPVTFTAGISTIYVWVFVGGLITMSTLPFGLALGVSRRSFYLGSALLGVAIAIADALGLTALQAIERASGGWGFGLHFFRVTYLFDGPWYITLGTSAAILALMFMYGMWYGIVHRRWKATGMMIFIAAQSAVVAAGVVVASWTRAWADVGHFFTALSAIGLAGIAAGLAVLLLLGGFATVRRVTV